MRRYGFDWLRIFVIFLLFPFHTARVFDAWEINYVKDSVNGFSTWFVAALSYWFMPLLFFIAGYAAYQALGKRTPRQFIRERVTRLLVPLLFGIILIVPPQGYLAAVQQYGYTGGYLSFLGQYFLNFSDISGYTGGFTPGHLWFILYLLIISLLMTGPLLWMVRRPNRLRPLAKPWVMLLGFVPVTLMQVLPAFGDKNLFYYAMFFALGTVFANSNVFMDIVKRGRFAFLAAALCTGAGMLTIAGVFGWQSGYSLVGIGFELLRNLAAWLMILALIGLADTYFNRPGKALAYFNRASYPVYLVHQTLLLAAAYYIVASDVSPAVKFVAIVLAGLALSFAVYELCRRFRTTRFMLGIK